jgi:hypothetical protein
MKLIKQHIQDWLDIDSSFYYKNYLETFNFDDDLDWDEVMDDIDNHYDNYEENYEYEELDNIVFNKTIRRRRRIYISEEKPNYKKIQEYSYLSDKEKRKRKIQSIFDDCDDSNTIFNILKEKNNGSI